jgi:hypothetical protein
LFTFRQPRCAGKIVAEAYFPAGLQGLVDPSGRHTGPVAGGRICGGPHLDETRGSWGELERPVSGRIGRSADVPGIVDRIIFGARLAAAVLKAAER